MPPAQRKSAKKHARSKPYDAAVGSSSSIAAASQSGAPSTASSSSSHTQDDKDLVAYFTEKLSFREICLSGIAKFLPGYTPQDDFEILALISWQHRPANPTEAQIAEQIANGTRNMERDWGETASQTAHNKLEEMVEPTGFKPTAKTRHVYTRPLPGSEYSIRLFPGQYLGRLWTMDFVLTATGEPVNSPFEFELLSVPNPKTPWIFGFGGRIRSVERSFGVKPNEILPGEEKFIVQDGQTCLLTRPGKRTVRFTVPIRPLPETEKEEPVEYDDIDFPEVLSPSVS